MNEFQMKIFEEINLILIIIYSFVKFNALLGSPKSLHGLFYHGNALQFTLREHQ